MRLEFINRVVDGERLGKSILTQDGNVLLRAGITLTSQYIRKLKDLGVFYVYVEDDRLSDVSVCDDKIMEIKKNTIKCISDIEKSVNNSNMLQFKKSIEKVGELVHFIIDNGDISSCLYDVKTHDNYTYLHSIDTGIMAAFIGLTCGYKEERLKDLTMGAILHDIGKTKIDNSIVNKPDKLTEAEFITMKEHPKLGGEIVKSNFALSDTVIKIVEQHHERIDGRGYPRGLKGKEINKFANIVSVCDVYDAVSNDRIYRKRFSPNSAYELILAGSGTAFDKEIVESFKNTFSVYPLGACLKLSNNVEGYVIKQNKSFPDRPVIRVLYDWETKKSIPFYEIDLLENPNIVVEAIL